MVSILFYKGHKRKIKYLYIIYVERQENPERTREFKQRSSN